VPNYDVGEVFMLGDGEQLRIIHLDLKLDEAAVEHLYQEGINGIWIVEPVDQLPDVSAGRGRRSGPVRASRNPSTRRRARR
jgi:hypothetical protein